VFEFFLAFFVSIVYYGMKT